LAQNFLLKQANFVANFGMAGGVPQVEELLAKLAELQQAGHSFFVKV